MYEMQNESARAPAPRIGRVIVLHHHVTHLHPLVRIHRLIKRAENLPGRMAHKPLPRQAARVRQAFGKRGAGRKQKEPWSLHRMSRQHHHPGLDTMLAALGIEKLDAGDASARRIIVYPVHMRPGRHSRASLLRAGEVRVGGSGLGFGRAARPAPAAVDARRPPVASDRVDGDRRGKRMRAKLPRAAREHLRMPVHPMRGHRKRVWLRREWAAFAGHAELALDLLVVRTQLVVTERPVVAHTFRRARAKVRGMKPRHHAKPCQCPAADAGARLGDDQVPTSDLPRLGPQNLPAIRLRVLQVGRRMNPPPASSTLTENPRSAISFATTAPQAPAPMIRMSQATVAMVRQ